MRAALASKSEAMSAFTVNENSGGGVAVVVKPAV